MAILYVTVVVVTAVATVDFDRGIQYAGNIATPVQENQAVSYYMGSGPVLRQTSDLSFKSGLQHGPAPSLRSRWQQVPTRRVPEEIYAFGTIASYQRPFTEKAGTSSISSSRYLNSPQANFPHYRSRNSNHKKGSIHHRHNIQ